MSIDDVAACTIRLHIREMLARQGRLKQDGHDRTGRIINVTRLNAADPAGGGRPNIAWRRPLIGLK